MWGLLIVVGSWLLVSVAAPAAAQLSAPPASSGSRALGASTSIEGAEELVDQGHFQEALDALDGLAQGTLNRDSLLQLLEVRALAQLALSQSGAMRRTLAQLVAVDPEHDLPDHYPPPVRNALEAERSRSPGALTVDVRASAMDGGVRLTAEVAHDPGGLVAGTHLRTRGTGEAYTDHEGETLERPLGAGERIEYTAVAVGLGGVVLATALERTWMASAVTRGDGTGAGTAGTAGAAGAAGSHSTEEPADEGTWWLWVGILAGVLVAAAVVTGVVVGTSNGDSGPDDGHLTYTPVIHW